MIKGITTIELTDTKTGKKEVIQDKNMMTNAIQSLVGTTIEGCFPWHRPPNTIFPLCPNAMGGILLFSEPLEEDVNNIYAPSTNPCVGYASNNVNATANVKRGSLNLTESMKLDNGYKFVWDFTTSQANGLISAVALTHKNGGIAYFGDEYNSATCMIEMPNISTSSSGLAYSARLRYAATVEVNFKENYFISIYYVSNYKVIIQKTRKCFSKVGLNFDLGLTGDVILETYEILSANSINYQSFHDGKDGYWYGFQNKENSSGDATINWIKINKSDYSFTEGKWILSGVLLQSIGSMSNAYAFQYSVLNKGYLYIMAYNKTGLYKININNSNDVSYIPFGFTSSNTAVSTNGSSTMCVWNGQIIGRDYIIVENDSVIKKKSETVPGGISNHLFQNGVYALNLYYSGGNIYESMSLVTPYLATINNLPTPVTKTADKTMKITYVITEE